MNLWVFFNSLGAIALFLYGMKIMSDGIQRASGTKLRRFLNSMTHTKLKAVLAGIGLTSVIQSSSAVSVLTLSFVNAGLIKLISAFGIIVGANIGTTLTLWIVSLGFEIKLASLSLPILAIAIPFYFLKNSNIKHWATFLIGFALIFIAISLLQNNLEHLAKENTLYQWFGDFDPNNFANGLLFVLIGLVLTIVVQSSSASTSIMVVLYTLGLPLEACAMMIIGANIGTTATAQIAATIGNIYSKYTAYFHIFFNLIGGIIFFFIASPVIHYLDTVFSDNYLILAAFHTIFNVVTAIILFPFLGKIAQFLYAKRQRKSSQGRLQMMHSAFSVTPELYIYEATSMLGNFAGNIKQSITYLGRMITESDDEKLEELHTRIIQLEKEGDEMEEQIRTYLNQIFKMDLTGENSQKIHHLINISNELEYIGDLSIKTSHTHLLRRKSNSFITPKLRTHLLEIQDVISASTTHLIQNLNETEIDPSLPKSTQFEKEVNRIHDEAFEALMNVIHKNKIKPESAMYYRELIQNYELIGDHIYKANKSMVR